VFGWRNVEVRMVYEILQLVSNVVLAVFIVVLLQQLFTALIALVGGGSTIVCDAYGKITITDAGPIEAMRCSLMSKALKLTELYENMYVAARGPFAKFAKSFGILGFPLYYQGSWLWQSSPSHLYQEVENFRYLNDVLTHYLISINAYLGAVDFVQNTMLSLFLPIGIVLRSIPSSRGVGAFFISLAIGLYVVLPFVFFVTDPTFTSEKNTPYVSVMVDDPSRYCWKTFAGVASVQTLAPQFADIASAQSYDLSVMLERVSSLYVSLLLHPAVAFTITVIFIKYLTDIFGGDSQVILRAVGRLI